MGLLCLLWVALAAVAPGQAPMELTGPPSTAAGNTSVTPGHGSVRLSGGRSQCEGRVELEQGGIWGTVCDDEWDVTDGDVVCRQLRCGWAVRVLTDSAFGRGTGPILRDDVGCKGHEQHLGDCPAAPDHDCSHKEDAGVVCSEHQEWRLTGGMDGCAGRVEVFYRGTWSTVCDNAWMLYQCGGHQPSLAHCQWVYNKSAPCYQSQAAGAVCNGSQGLQTPTPMATVTMSNVTLLSTEVSPATGTLSPQLLFVLCLVLAALLLLTVLAFTAALLRVRKRSAHAVSPLGLAVPMLVTHSAQSPDVPSATPNDYREVPPSLLKGPDPAVTSHPITKDSSSDSDYEHYDFSSKPPVALSTFYTEPDPTDSSSTSSGEWYENVQGMEPPGDLSPNPGWPVPSCPLGTHAQDPDSSEGSDYDDIQGSAY
ncbi:T-cell differentiation antigen CD6 [Patagioenas fasciata monilis]|uniref:T-cell differentiation antigen CD6 n=1 Tax=Patagioenas fasciata monilis TaxID=372326 RepID=A0A1V4JPM7_PATFA|nr:T-cell differentiation antigen CD6 [Patagioenas fasciata monilis]